MDVTSTELKHMKIYKCFLNILKFALNFLLCAYICMGRKPTCNFLNNTERVFIQFSSVKCKNKLIEFLFPILQIIPLVGEPF